MPTVEGIRSGEHAVHGGDSANIPLGQVLVERYGAMERVKRANPKP